MARTLGSMGVMVGRSVGHGLSVASTDVRDKSAALWTSRTSRGDRETFSTIGARAQRDKMIAVWLLLLAMSAVLIACGEEQAGPGTGPSTQAADDPAIEAEEAADQEFAYLRYAVDETAVRPTLCLTFSEALDPATDYSAYVASEASLAFGVSGSRLCLGGLTYGQEARLTLRAGLPSADGDALKRDETVALTFDDRPAMVSFAGEGIILPRRDADGLAIKTVNVDAVEVSVRRVTDRALVFRSLTAGFSAAEGEYRYEGYNDSPGELGTSIWEGSLPTVGDTNETVTTVFPLADVVGTLEPGAYYVAIADAGAEERGVYQPARARRWILVTDLAFTAYRGESGRDATVRSLQTAKPMARTEVRLIARSNEVLATSQTDRDGRVRFDAPLLRGTEGNAPRMLMAYGRDGDFAVLDLNRAPVDLSSHPVTGRTRPEGADAYLYLDRGIYRPGETVQATALVRDGAGRAIANRPGAFVLTQPNGLEYTRERFEGLPNAGGGTVSLELPAAAARGMWRLTVELDGLGTVGDTSLSVEDFVPQRVALDLEAAETPPLTAGDTRLVTAQARFLYGAPGAGLPITGRARVQVDPNPFPAWEGFAFGRHDEQFAEILFTLPNVTADGEGRAMLPIAIGTRGKEATKPLRVRAVIEVEEPGGRAVADDIRLPYRPRGSYWGLKPTFDGSAARGKESQFEVLAVNRVGDAADAKAEWRLVRREYDYDWYRTPGGDWRWRRSERSVPIEEGVIAATAEGPSTISLAPLDWGDYALTLSVDGQDIASASFWVGWQGRTVGGVEAPDEVRVATPDAPTPAGSSASITIQPPYGGEAEIVVATDQVISTQHVSVSAEGTEIALPVTEEWGAGAYVMVTVYTPRDSVTSPKPRRAVGVAYLPVDVGPRTFDVTLGTPEITTPNQDDYIIPLEVSGGPRGQAVYATIAAVDEGILQLTKFSSPNPTDWFYGKARLGVSLHDDYGRLLDPNQGAAAPTRSGGDQIGGAGLTVVPTKTVARFSGLVSVDGNGRAAVPVTLPDFNGELRLMAVAWSDTGVGATSQAMTVRDKVPAELILPRFLAPGDTASATLTLDNVAGAAGEYRVSTGATGPISAPTDETSVSLEKSQRTDRPVTITANGEGIANLSLNVSGPGGFRAESRYPMEVRSAFLPVSRTTNRVLAPGESFAPGTALLDGYEAGSSFLQVSVAPSPIDISSLYQSLVTYPYQCTEQLVSRAMPALYTGDLAAMSGQSAPEKAGKSVRQAVETLLSRQGRNGAIGLWRQGDRQASPWIGAYAADFLTRAATEGYAVPEAAKTRALDALLPIAKGQLYRSSGYVARVAQPRWTSDTQDRLMHRSSAYALYVLARNERADRSRLRYMHDELIDKIESPLARAHVGAALAALGDRGRATSAFEKAVDALGYQNRGDWYQTTRRDVAGVLALAAEAGMTDLIEPLTEKVTTDLPEPARLTTQEKAHLLLAAQALAGDGDTLNVAYSGEAPTPSLVAYDEESLKAAGAFTNEGDTPLWITTYAEGAPSAPPPADAQDVSIEKSFRKVTGEAVDLGALKRGDRLVVSITLTPGREAQTPFIIADLLAAGLEIETILRPEDAGEKGAYAFLGDLARPQVAEARDDRFVAAITTTGTNPVRFAYIARAVTPGDFTLPGTVTEHMYNPVIYGRSAPGRIRVAP